MAKKKKRKSRRTGRPVGRPTVITPEALGKIEQVFAYDGSVLEACSFAEIDVKTYYNYLKKNPEYIQRIQALRQRPFLKARKAIVDNLSNPEFALKYMERKRKYEFSTRAEITGAEGKPLIVISQETQSCIEEWDKKRDEINAGSNQTT